MSQAENPIEHSEAPLFAFAGIDGSGKTTLINNLASELRIKGLPVAINKAYTGEIKEAMGHIISDADDIETMFLFQAFHRRQHNHALARLAMGDIVLADRWRETYDAYHSQYGILSEEADLRNSLDHLAYSGLTAYKTFYLQIDESTGMRRTHARGADFFDAKPLAYHKSQVEYYDRVAVEDPTWVTLNANKSPEALTYEALSIIEQNPFLAK